MATFSENNANLKGFEQSLNPEFRQVVRSMRRTLPYIAASFLFFVYAVSAWIGGSLLTKITSDTLNQGVILAFAMTSAIQVGRMILVFYPLLNPTRPTIGYNGEITGIILGAVSIFEIWGLVMAVDMPRAVAVTSSILMVIGVLAELYFLREIKFFVKMELISNKEYWHKIINARIMEKQFEQMMDRLDQGDIPDELIESTPAPLPANNARKAYEDYLRIAEAEAQHALQENQLKRSAPRKVNPAKTTASAAHQPDNGDNDFLELSPVTNLNGHKS